MHNTRPPETAKSRQRQYFDKSNRFNIFTVPLLFLLKFLYGAGGNGSYIRGVLHFLRYGCQRVNDRCVCFFEILAYFLKCEVGNLF